MNGVRHIGALYSSSGTLGQSVHIHRFADGTTAADVYAELLSHRSARRPVANCIAFSRRSRGIADRSGDLAGRLTQPAINSGLPLLTKPNSSRLRIPPAGRRFAAPSQWPGRPCRIRVIFFPFENVFGGYQQVLAAGISSTLPALPLMSSMPLAAITFAAKSCEVPRRAEVDVEHRDLASGIELRM